MKGIIYLLLLIILSKSCFAQSAKEDHGITQQLDSIVKNYVDSIEFMGSVLIEKNGTILLKKGYGFADIENQIPNTPSTNFYLASVSKLFTVAAIIELKNKGLLKLDDSLTKFIPNFPNGNRITIRQLIEHKSGIVDFVNERPYELIKKEIKLENIIDTFKYLPLNFEPGEKYSYSGSGYILLAYIIEKVSGISYSDYIEKNIFEKLGMNTSFSNWNNIPKTLAKGYSKENGRFKSSEYFHPSQFVGAGNLMSTVEDMYKWYEAIYKKNEISLEYQTDHEGRIGGWVHTNFYPVFASDYAIIILSNYGDASVIEMAKEIRHALDQDGEKYQKISSALMEKYVGNYYADDTFYLVIEKGDNCLISHANDNNNTVYSDTTYKVAEDEFKRSDMRLTFNEKSNNLYNKVFVFWGVNGYVYKRANYRIDKKNSKLYTGSFKLDNQTLLTVSYENEEFLTIRLDNLDGTFSKFSAKGTNESNFIYPYGRLIFDQIVSSKFQRIRLVADGRSYTGNRNK